MAGQDFVHVQLTAAGAQMAGKGGYVRITRGRCEMTFSVGQAQRVTRAYDWNKVLSGVHFKGQPVFEIVPDASGNAPASPDATPTQSRHSSVASLEAAVQKIWSQGGEGK